MVTRERGFRERKRVRVRNRERKRVGKFWIVGSLIGAKGMGLLLLRARNIFQFENRTFLSI